MTLLLMYALIHQKSGAIVFGWIFPLQKQHGIRVATVEVALMESHSSPSKFRATTQICVYGMRIWLGALDSNSRFKTQSDNFIPFGAQFRLEQCVKRAIRVAMSHISQFEAEQLQGLWQGRRPDLEATDQALAQDRWLPPGPGSPSRQLARRQSYHFELQTPATALKFRGRAQQPYSRRISFHPDLLVDLEDEINQTVTSNICHRSWRVFRVSPLFEFCYNEAALARWSESLERDLWTQHGLQDQGDWKRLKISISAVPGLRGSTDDEQAICIEGHTRKGHKEAFVVYLVSVDRQDKLNLEESFKATILPVMLTFGPDELIRIVRRSVEKHFDCVTGIVVFPQAELKWMSALWIDLQPEKAEGRKRKLINDDEDIEAESDGKTEPIKSPMARDSRVNFFYKMPEEHSNFGIKKFEVKLIQEQLVELWKSIHDDTEYFATMHEVHVFHQALLDKLQLEMGVNFNLMKLSRVELPTVSVDSGSRVIIHSTKHVKTFLRLFTELCQLSINSHCPRIGIPTEESYLM
eukprot:maker-scaffold119_size336447-snap-gene-2.33 protein:Tk11789 transcript:maker-scaffold119_size336447-snap-gene-2.33-mRNA-1 annotation:"hypothetical protein BRAFLDRAFT_123952"